MHSVWTIASNEVTHGLNIIAATPYGMLSFCGALLIGGMLLQKAIIEIVESHRKHGNAPHRTRHKPRLPHRGRSPD